MPRGTKGSMVRRGAGCEAHLLHERGQALLAEGADGADGGEARDDFVAELGEHVL